MDTDTESGKAEKTEVRIDGIAQAALMLGLLNQLMEQRLLTLDQAHQVFNRAADYLVATAPGLAETEPEREEMLALAAVWRGYFLSLL